MQNCWIRVFKIFDKKNKNAKRKCLTVRDARKETFAQLRLLFPVCQHASMQLSRPDSSLAQ